MVTKHSENLNELFSALSKLQGKIENAKKDKAGFNNNYKYAQLNQYIELSKDLLAEYGLCILQIPESIEIVEITKEFYDKENKKHFFQQIMTPKQKITTWIGHESGQFISGSMEIIVEKMTANSWGQSTGVAVSFARRYALAGSLGMTQEDNDNQLPKTNYERIDKKQADNIKSLLKDDPERFKKMLLWANVQSVEDLSVVAYEVAIKKLLKDQPVPANKDSYLIDQSQVAYLKKLLTHERLDKILNDYNLTKIEDMKLEDYFKEYDKLREEMTISINDISDIKQA